MLQSHGFKGERQYSARGRFFLYQSSNAAAIGADERIAVEANGQPLGDFYVGDNIELPAATDSWRVTPYAQTLVGVVVIGDGTVRTNRVAGAVSIIETDHMATLAGKQFIGAPSQTANATKIRALGIKASGKAITIRRLMVSSPVAGDVQIAFCQGDPIPAFTNGVGLPNKLAGSPNLLEALTQRFDSPGANLVAGVDYAAVTGVAMQYMAANIPSEFPLSRPLVLPDGWSVVVHAGVVNRAITVTVDGEVMP
jgi:hypothetical protein